jgi:hypothetical protein
MEKKATEDDKIRKISGKLFFSFHLARALRRKAQYKH